LLSNCRIDLNFKTASKVTQHDPRDDEWEKHMNEHLKAQGREATHYVEIAGKIVDITVEPVVLEGNPADEIVNFAEKNDIELIIMGSLGKNRSLAIPTGECSRKCGQIF